MTLILNIFGAPGSGKSVTALGVTADLCVECGLNAQYVHEEAKTQLIKGQPVNNQLEIFGKQATHIMALIGGADVVVCDSPLLMFLQYASMNDFQLPDVYSDFVEKIADAFPSQLNVLLKRNVPYQSWGRYQTEEESDRMSEDIQRLIGHRPYVVYSTTEAKSEIIKSVKSFYRNH